MRRAALLLATLLSACGEPPATVSPDSQPADLARTFSLAPGAFAEANLSLPAGRTVRADFNAGQVPITWNVHSHPGDQVVIHDQGTATAGTIEFAAPAAGPFSRMWENGAAASTELSVALELPAGASIESWHP
jgi:hypothetical protein